jgi:predicted nucleic acid-binding protein
MLKKLIDTNIFIDRFASPARFKELFLSQGQIYLSAVVLMELRAGAHSKPSIKAYNDLSTFFQRVDRILTPSKKDYEVAGELLARLQNIKGYEIRKIASITNDCLIAVSARSNGATVYTQNGKDFTAIREVFDIKLHLLEENPQL